MGNRSKQNFQKKELKWPRNRKWSLSWCHQGNANLNYFEIHLIPIRMPRTITTSSYKFDFIHFLGHDKELWIRCDSLFYYRISSIYFLTQLKPRESCSTLCYLRVTQGGRGTNHIQLPLVPWYQHHTQTQSCSVPLQDDPVFTYGLYAPSLHTWPSSYWSCPIQCKCYLAGCVV